MAVAENFFRNVFGSTTDGYNVYKLFDCYRMEITRYKCMAHVRLIEGCKMNGLCPVEYIADVLQKIISGETDYMALLSINIAKKLNY